MLPVPKITFLPAGVTLEVHEGVTVFSAANQAEVPIPSQCGGRCACALCKIELVEGAGLISPIGWEEEGHLGNAFHLTATRLSCQTQVFGDVVVRIPELPVKERARGRFVPRSIMKKREEMEHQEEMRRVRRGASPKGSPQPDPSSPRQEARSESTGSKGGGRRNRRGRSRNPGAPRRGDSRPPPGAKKKD